MVFKDSFFIEQDKKSWAKRMDDTLIIRTGKTIHEVNLFIEELINGKEVDMETESYALAAFDSRFGTTKAQLHLACRIINLGLHYPEKATRDVINVLQQLTHFITLYDENKRLFHTYKAQLVPVRNLMIRIYMIISSAVIDLLSRGSDKKCQFKNLRDWMDNPRKWDVNLVGAWNWRELLR